MTCNTCSSASSHLLFMKERYRVVQCDDCGLVYIENPMRKALVKRAYDEGYTGAEGTAESSSYARGKPFRMLEANRRLDSMGDIQRVLDVGTGLGFFLLAAQSRGIEGVGCDLSSVAAGYARSLGLEVYDGDLLGLDIKGPFDAVTFWASIEHLYDPKSTLEKARGLLVPGGLLVIETGDIGSPQARLFGKSWRLFQDDHNFYYSSATLDELLRRTGFTPIRTEHDGFVEGIAKQLGIQKNTLPRGTSGLKELLNRAAGRLGFGDVMIKYAVKSTA